MRWRMHCFLGIALVLGLDFSGMVAMIPSVQQAQGATETLEKIGKNGAPMILIPAGPFLMGVTKWARDGGRDEYPNHEVELPDYYIDKYEVTNGRYLEFVRGTGHRVHKHRHASSKNLWHARVMP